MPADDQYTREALRLYRQYSFDGAVQALRTRIDEAAKSEGQDEVADQAQWTMDALYEMKREDDQMREEGR